MSTRKFANPAVRHRELLRIAYRLWHEAGRPPAPYSRFWTEAERRIDEASSNGQGHINGNGHGALGVEQHEGRTSVPPVGLVRPVL